MRWSRESCKTACDFVIHQLVAIPKLDDDDDAAADDDDGDHDHDDDDVDDDDDYGNIFSESCKGKNHSFLQVPLKQVRK